MENVAKGFVFMASVFYFLIKLLFIWKWVNIFIRIYVK